MRQVLVSALLCAVALTGSAVMDGGRSGLRWEVRESDGSVVRVLTDSERLITLEYNNRSQLIQCWDSKEGSTADAVSLMFYSAMADQHTVSEKQAVTIDLDAVMANCSQYLSDVSDDTELQTMVETAEQLKLGVDGTRYCGLTPTASLKSRTAVKREDKCCKTWHNCALKIDAYRLAHSSFNYRSYPLLGCNCTEQLQRCLTNITTSLSEEIQELMFGNYNLKCLDVSNQKIECKQWDPFYNECIDHQWGPKAAVTSLNEYRLASELRDNDQSESKQTSRGSDHTEL